MYIASLTSGNPHRAELDKQLRLNTATIPNVPCKRIHVSAPSHINPALLNPQNENSIRNSSLASDEAENE